MTPLLRASNAGSLKRSGIAALWRACRDLAALLKLRPLAEVDSY